MALRRATKIVATLGPASSDPDLLEQMIRAGVNVVRLNFSHGTAQDHINRAQLVREAAQRAGREVAIMADLQGPKIRVGKFADGKVMLKAGAKFVLDATRVELGDEDEVGLDYKSLPREVKAGDTLALREKSKNQLRVQDALKLAQSVGLCDWVQVDATKMEGVFKKVPDRDQFGAEIKEALIVELYSR